MGVVTAGFGSTQRVDLGRCGNAGSSIKLGMTMMVRFKITADSAGRNSTIVSFNHDSAALNAQSFYWHINAHYNSGPNTNIDSVLFNCGDATDTGLARDMEIPSGTPNWNDQQWHHLAISFDLTDSAHVVKFYLDGAEFNTWNTPLDFTDNLTNGPLLDWTEGGGLPLAARALTSMASYTDFTGGEWEDFRLYKRIVPINQIAEISKLGGWDTIADAYVRYNFAGVVTNTGTLTVSQNGGDALDCVLQNGAAFASTFKQNGYRRRG